MREYAHQQTAMLLRRLAFQVNRTARSCTADSIHDLRVSIRRFNRCLRAFSQFYPARARKKIRQQLRELMNAAANVRDRDISLALLEEAGISRRAAIARRLEGERRQATQELLIEISRWRNRSFSGKWREQLEL
jgi:CHAD domain-containing protein